MPEGTFEPLLKPEISGKRDQDSERKRNAVR
jgi:hypothetical protein